ncbi:SGNH/GDSL hydrolase family protein [Candidatus Gottesmanbacteria bacterium]|nr:SGNH/GDSL hydrolase family protein [Candidatus Gottesmanbacteria bacterium]
MFIYLTQKISWKFIVFLFWEVTLIGIIFLLGFKLFHLIKGRVKGVQYETKIDKNNLLFDSSGDLKYFYEPKPNSIQTWNPDWLGYEVQNQINSDSLNELKEYSIDKPQNTFRIITLGDSFTYGQFVKTEENYSKVLENLLSVSLVCKPNKKFEVINLGVPGYDINYTVERFIRRGKKYNPDLVIWLLNSWNFYQLKEYMIPQMEQYGNQADIYNTKAKEYTIVEKITKEFKSLYGEQKILDLDKKMLEHMQNNFDGRIIFVAINLDKKYQDLLDVYVHSNKDKFSFKNAFNIWQNENYHFLDEHPNREGHKKIAEDLFTYLKNNYFSYCSMRN